MKDSIFKEVNPHVDFQKTEGY